MTTISKLSTECAAKTISGKGVGLRAGTEVQATKADVVEFEAANPGAKAMRAMCRSPRAKNFAPYDVDLSDISLSLHFA